MSNRFGLLFLLSASFSLTVQAQVPNKNIDDIQIVFDKVKEITLPIEEKPLTNRQQELPRDTSKRSYAGFNDELTKPTNVLDLKPRVLNYSAEKEAGGKPNYVKLGVGNFLTTHGEALYTHGSKEDYISAKLLHFNNALGSQKWASQGVNQLDVFGTYKALKGRIKANLLLENNRNTLYSFIPEGAERSDIRISNFRTGFEAGYAFSKSKKYDLDLGVNLNAITSFNSQKSYFAAASVRYNHYLDENKALGFKPTVAINKINGTQQRSVGFFDFLVDYSHKVDKLTVRPHLKFMYESDTIDSKNVHLYPGIDASYAISDRVGVFASATSDYSQNLFFDQVKANPWVNDIANFSYLNMPLSLTAGVQASMSNLALTVTGGLKQYKNYLVFAPYNVSTDSLGVATGDSSRFYTINLKDQTVSLPFLNVTASYRISNTFNIETGLLLQSATSSFKPGVPNVPAVTWRISPALKIDNFSLIPSLILRSSYDVLTPRLTVVESGATYDLAAKASYSVSDRINVNLDVYNLVNNRPQAFYGYYSRGAVVVLGGSLKF